MTATMKHDPALPDWARDAVNLASERLGAQAIACSDDSFAAMDRMLQDTPPVFKPDVYDDFGKWMDGWESKRRRGPGYDWCVVKLGAAGRIRGVEIDTSHFTGNYPPSASLWASAADAPDPANPDDWVDICDPVALGPSARHFFELTSFERWTHVRLNIFPDGGVARLRVYGAPAPNWDAMAPIVELSALSLGGRIVAYNDAHYGDVSALLSPGRGKTMGDGWETRRRREPGADWIIVALAARGEIERVEVDTAHFKGNFPDACSLQAADAPALATEALVAQSMFWTELMAPQKLGADAIHVFGRDTLATTGSVTHVKLTIHPDGGVSRLRLFGRRT